MTETASGTIVAGDVTARGVQNASLEGDERDRTTTIELTPLAQKEVSK